MSRWWRAAAGVLKTAAETPVRRSYHTIQAVPREISGHRIAVRERAQGRIPAVVFSQSYVQTDPNDPTSVAASSSVSRNSFLLPSGSKLRLFSETLISHSSVPPLSRFRSGLGQIHTNEDGNIMNLVFVWAEDGTELKVDVPIVYKGEDVCPGLKKGGCLRKIRTSLRYMSLAEHIPAKIEVDVSKLDIGDGVSMHDVVVHPSLKLLSKNETLPICKIMPTYVENVKST
ncbi:hypothetical protein DH2020_012335 [Rehmannia glutinosa]|uniref:Large ribosomal subunit protein bL25 beta domain-containing protein n=1 Tax=Rehmannia glutinosa TaxID=99300 RepID=A0ABR0X0J1_REHGL